MKLKMINSIFILIAFASCGKEDLPDDTIIPKKDSVQILWKHYLNPDSSESYTGKFMIDNEKLYFVNKYFKPWSLVQSKKLTDGELVWTYDNYLIGEDLGDMNIEIINKQIVYNPSGYFFNINTDDGNLVLDNPEYKNGMDWLNKLSYFGTNIYAGSRKLENGEHYVQVSRRSYDKIDWEVLYHEDQGVEGYEKFVGSPSFYTTPDGDTILLFANRMWHFPKVKGRADFIAYSLRDREVLWRVDSVDYNSSVIPPLVHEGNAIFRGDDEIISYDILSGKEEWRFKMPIPQEDVLLTGSIIHDGKYYIQGSNFNTLYCLDARSGQLIWKNNDHGGESRQLHYFDGQIIFSSHSWLSSVDAISGKTIWKRRAKDFGMKGSFNGWMPIGLNARDSVIYACDGRELAALKIPPKK